MNDSEKAEMRIRKMSRWGMISFPLCVFLGIVIGGVAGGFAGNIGYGVSIGAGLGVGFGAGIAIALLVFRSPDPPDSH